jgi:hypothetical protein
MSPCELVPEIHKVKRLGQRKRGEPITVSQLKVEGGGVSDKTTAKKFRALFPYLPLYDIEMNHRLSTSIYII